jgi:hypothetical protein
MPSIWVLPGFEGGRFNHLHWVPFAGPALSLEGNQAYFATLNQGFFMPIRSVQYLNGRDWISSSRSLDRWTSP